MGIFDKLFKGSDEPETEETTLWTDLNRIEQLDELVELSREKPQLIFKHSTRCGISRMVINQFKKDHDFSKMEADMYYLDLLSHRDISQAIADRFKVEHESPQLLIVKNSLVVKHASHGGINEMALENLV